MRFTLFLLGVVRPLATAPSAGRKKPDVIELDWIWIDLALR